MIPYTCPACGTFFEFRKRVTLTVRRCPHCNEEVTVDEIDRQTLIRQERAAALLRVQIVAWTSVVLGLVAGFNARSVWVGIFTATGIAVITVVIGGLLVMAAKK